MLHVGGGWRDGMWLLAGCADVAHRVIFLVLVFA